MRARYVDHLLSLLAPQVPMLLLTFEYPAHEIDGPPFSVGEEQVRALYEGKSQSHPAREPRSTRGRVTDSPSGA